MAINFDFKDKYQFDDLVEMIRSIKAGDIETATKLEGGLQK